jgi:predicted dithiol-disulfide oxidoreductase (DUF899 family)
MTQKQVEHPKVVSQTEWLAARKQLLKKEKELTKLRDALSQERRELPWVKVDKQYVFNGPGGKKSLAELSDGALVHLAQRDVTFLAVSRAPLTKIEEFKKRMGWRFNWVSSFGTDFNRDFHVSFTKEEMATGKVDYNYEMAEFPSEEAPGISVFYKDKNGDIFHTYSAYARGTEMSVGTYNYLDLVPKGRDEDALPFTMSWVRHHDRYIDGRLADPTRPYWPTMASDAARSGG